MKKTTLLVIFSIFLFKNTYAYDIETNESLIQTLNIDLDSDGDKDKIDITKNSLSNGYVIDIFDSDKFGNFKKINTNSYIYSCSRCIKTEKILYNDNLIINKKNEFSIRIENMSNNAKFTFRKLDNGRWYLINFQSSYMKSNGKWITKRKSYMKKSELILFDKFNPNLFY